MTRRRWIADEISGNRAFLIGPHADHLARVLRARVGQEFDIAAGTSVHRGRIVTIDRDRVEFELGEEVPAVATASVTLVLSVFKFDRLEWAIEKCTELGVTRIVPLIACRTDAHLASAAVKRVERWRRIAREASEQSRRASVPEVADPVKLKEAVTLAGATRILLAETREEASLQDALRTDAQGSMILAVGPEGGWTEPEADLFRQAGWVFASLGRTILRAETAAIAAVAIVMAELG
jgi:16S rRNA (uracil1498-N3)-methyltransferase